MVREDRNGMDKVRNFGARHASVYAMPRIGIADFKKGRGDALQLCFTVYLSDLLGSLHALRDSRKTFKPGFPGAASGTLPPVDVGPEGRRIYRRFLSGIEESSGRFRTAVISVSFSAGRGLEIV